MPSFPSAASLFCFQHLCFRFPYSTSIHAPLLPRYIQADRLYAHQQRVRHSVAHAEGLLFVCSCTMFDLPKNVSLRHSSINLIFFSSLNTHASARLGSNPAAVRKSIPCGAGGLCGRKRCDVALLRRSRFTCNRRERDCACVSDGSTTPGSGVGVYSGTDWESVSSL